MGRPFGEDEMPTQAPPACQHLSPFDLAQFYFDLRLPTNLYLRPWVSSDIKKKGQHDCPFCSATKFRNARMIRNLANMALNTTTGNTADCLRTPRAKTTKTKKD
jgi:hypothetical protein